MSRGGVSHRMANLAVTPPGAATPSAGVTQWSSAALPAPKHRFDSDRPLQIPAPVGERLKPPGCKPGRPKRRSVVRIHPGAPSSRRRRSLAGPKRCPVKAEIGSSNLLDVANCNTPASSAAEHAADNREVSCSIQLRGTRFGETQRACARGASPPAATRDLGSIPSPTVVAVAQRRSPWP